MIHEEFINIILPLKDKLFRLALSITGNKQDAEDVVQDTLLQIWKKQNEWDVIKNLEGYCMRAARNIALDKISLKDNQADILSEDFETQGTNSHDIVEQLECSEQIRIINELIGRLPEKQKTIVQLRDIEGLSYKEIADIMDISEEQIKIILFRSRQKLKQHFASINNYGTKRN